MFLVASQPETCYGKMVYLWHTVIVGNRQSQANSVHYAACIHALLHTHIHSLTSRNLENRQKAWDFKYALDTNQNPSGAL